MRMVLQSNKSLPLAPSKTIIFIPLVSKILTPNLVHFCLLFIFHFIFCRAACLCCQLTMLRTNLCAIIYKERLVNTANESLSMDLWIQL